MAESYERIGGCKMILKVIITGIVLYLPVFFSLAKSAGNADRRLEELHDAFFLREERNGKTSQESQ
jgi:hypothetical protein